MHNQNIHQTKMSAAVLGFVIQDLAGIALQNIVPINMIHISRFAMKHSIYWTNKN